MVTFGLTRPPAIRAEVDHLLRIYGGIGSFAGYARRFRDALDLIGLLESDVRAAPAPPADRPTPPARLRLGLSGFAAARQPLPADWAFSWLRSCPEFQPRTATSRCEPEFTRLFHARYVARYGHVRARARPLIIEGTVIVAHNAMFDTGMLTAEFLRAGAAPDDLLSLCTLELARRHGRSARSLRLADCLNAEGLA